MHGKEFIPRDDVHLCVLIDETCVLQTFVSRVGIRRTCQASSGWLDRWINEEGSGGLLYDTYLDFNAIEIRS